jgi:predicted ABC-type ATPase
VPKAKLAQRFPRTLANLKAAIPSLEHVYVVDNSSLLRPFRLLAHFKRGKAIVIREPLPEWFKSVLPDGFLALAEG